MATALQGVDTKTIEAKIASYEESRRKGVEFILRQTNPDGSIGPVDKGVFYYRIPWALALSGQTGPAMRVTEWIRRRMLTAQGEVAGSVSLAGLANRSGNTYAETCLAYGAQILRRYDVAQEAIGFALRFQDPVTGGVYQDRERLGPADPQILFLTCQLGMSALLTGHVPEALSAGHFVRRLWEAQPELPDRLYTIYTRSGGLATTVPDGGDRSHYVNESQQVKERHYNGGMAAAFLVRLFWQTGDTSWLDLARGYQAFSMNTTERQFETKQVCKSAWGGGLLFTATKEPVYRDWALRMGDWFVKEQFDDGHWENTHYLTPNPGLHQNLEITAEFVVHVDTIIGSLSTGLVD